MNDGDPLNERPDPTEGYGDMTFDELGESIEHSLDRRSSDNPDPADPSTEEEYFSLLGLMREKAPASPPHRNAQPKRAPLTPEQRLFKLRQKRLRTEQYLLENYDKPSTTKKAISKAERTWDELG